MIKLIVAKVTAKQIGGRVTNGRVTFDAPCPVCRVTVFAPFDPGVRVDCLDCGVALVTQRGSKGGQELELGMIDDDTVVVDPGTIRPPMLSAGQHLAAFDAGSLSFEDH